jgi:CelD/BcsL family acetyltransferase involved in cellulose biosynthesis
VFAVDISITDRLEDVEADWDRLEQTGLLTPFQRRGWLGPWYRHVAPAFGATPLFAIARDRETGEPVMLLPLCRRFDGSHDVIEFADLGVSDYNAPVIGHRAMSDADLADLWAAMRHSLPRADLIRMDKMPERIDGRRNPLVATGGVHRIGMSAWGVDLPADRAAFDSERLGASFLKEMRKKHRRIEGRGAVNFLVPETADEALDMFATLAEMRAARFAELGRHNVLGTPACRTFYDEVVRHSWGTGLAYVAALDVGDERVATLFGLRGRGSFHLLMSTFTGEKWKSCSPGNVLIDRAITAMIGEGLRYFDFTIGDEAYKRDFGASELALYGGAAHLSLSGLVEAFKGQVKGALMTRLRQHGMAQAARNLLGTKAVS